jgi:cell division inhibitor SulA/protein ImuA
MKDTEIFVAQPILGSPFFGSPSFGSQIWRGKSARFSQQVISTGFANLDEHLPGGGWPQRSITEVFLDYYGIGELTLLIPALRELTQRRNAADKKWVIFIAPPFIPYAPALVQRGIDIELLLMVHPTAGNKNNLWAVEQAVRSGSSAAVLAWLQMADGVALRRLQLAAEQQGCWTVLFRPMSALSERSPAALRIRLFIEDAVTRLQILKSRGGRPSVVNLATYERKRTGEPR